MSILVLYVLLLLVILVSIISVILNIKVIKYLLITLGVIFINLIIYVYIGGYLLGIKYYGIDKMIQNQKNTYNKIIDNVDKEIQTCKNKNIDNNEKTSFKYIVCDRKRLKPYILDDTYKQLKKANASDYLFNNKINNDVMGKIRKTITFLLVIN